MAARVATISQQKVRPKRAKDYICHCTRWAIIIYDGYERCIKCGLNPKNSDPRRVRF